MKQLLKDTIAKEYQNLFTEDKVQMSYAQIMQRVRQPLPWYRRIDREDFHMLPLIVLFIGIVYIFGFDPRYKLTVSMDSNLTKNFIIGATGVLILVFLGIQDYFDRKKFLQI